MKIRPAVLHRYYFTNNKQIIYFVALLYILYLCIQNRHGTYIEFKVVLAKQDEPKQVGLIVSA